MIACTEFIAAYSELFKFLEKKGGKKAVADFWNYLSDLYLKASLKKLVKLHGIRGCWLYWAKALNEEAADFTMELDDKAGIFKINMHYCPSKGRLLHWRHLKPYAGYCLHCDVLYRRILEPLGYCYAADFSQTDKARCSVVITRNGPGRVRLKRSSAKNR
ncbi:MAG: hypothetical protein PHW60_09515 [Kiritimatiellae bacterium]|nr:hypothetical protein [Kiritimatiellia bacterium]